MLSLKNVINGVLVSLISLSATQVIFRLLCFWGRMTQVLQRRLDPQRNFPLVPYHVSCVILMNLSDCIESYHFQLVF